MKRNKNNNLPKNHTSLSKTNLVFEVDETPDGNSSRALTRNQSSKRDINTYRDSRWPEGPSPDLRLNRKKSKFITPMEEKVRNRSAKKKKESKQNEEIKVIE